MIKKRNSYILTNCCYLCTPQGQEEAEVMKTKKAKLTKRQLAQLKRFIKNNPTAADIQLWPMHATALKNILATGEGSPENISAIKTMLDGSIIIFEDESLNPNKNQ